MRRKEMALALLQQIKQCVRDLSTRFLAIYDLKIEESKMPDGSGFTATPGGIKIGKFRQGYTNKVLTSQLE